MMPSSENPALIEMLAGFSRLLQTGQYSDLTICSKDRKYAVHKSIVCTQSTFFETACASGFREKESNVIELLHDDPDAVDCMIRYLYTLKYPEEPAEPLEPSEDSTLSPKPTFPLDSVSPDQVSNNLEEGLDDLGQPTIDGTEIAMVGTASDQDENHGPAAQDSLQTRDQSSIDQSAATFDISLCRLDQDLQVYVLGEKYGIPDLKQKAAQDFQKVLGDADITVEVFSIIQGIYSMTMPEDRALRDIVTAKLYGEIQHWTQDKDFMETLRGEGDFSADLLSYTVKENLRQQEVTIATIQHPGYCDNCRASLVVKRFVSKRRNVTIKKHCAQCEPWA